MNSKQKKYIEKHGLNLTPRDFYIQKISKSNRMQRGTALNAQHYFRGNGIESNEVTVIFHNRYWAGKFVGWLNSYADDIYNKGDSP